MNFILAVSSNKIIGNGYKLPWNIKEEYSFFLKKINKPNSSLLCGRKTFECILKESPTLLNIKNIYVLTKDINNIKDVRNVENTKDIKYIKDIKDIKDIRNVGNIWCIGGSSLYNKIDEIIPNYVYLTHINIIVDEDKYNVKINDSFFKFLYNNYKKIYEKNEYYVNLENNEKVLCIFQIYSL